MWPSQTFSVVDKCGFLASEYVLAHDCEITEISVRDMKIEEGI